MEAKLIASAARARSAQLVARPTAPFFRRRSFPLLVGKGVNAVAVYGQTLSFQQQKFPTTNKTKVLFESASAGTRPPQVRAVYPNLCAVGVGCSFDIPDTASRQGSAVGSGAEDDPTHTL